MVNHKRVDRLYAEARLQVTLDGTRKAYLADLAAVPLLIVDDLGMRKLPHTAAEDLLEIIMRRYERASTLLTSNRPVDDWASCSATPPPSPRCSIGRCITRTCSNAAHGAGGPNSRPTCAPRTRRSRTPLVSAAGENAGFALSINCRF